MNYHTVFVFSATIAALGPAMAQMVPPAQWVRQAGPGYTLLSMAKATTPEAKNHSYQILKAAEFENA